MHFVHFGEESDVVTEIAKEDVSTKLVEVLPGVSWEPVLDYVFFGFHFEWG